MATAGLRRRDGVRHHHQHVANGVWRPLLQRRGDRGPGDLLGDLAGLCLDLPLATHAAVGRADRRGADEGCLAPVSAYPSAGWARNTGAAPGCGNALTARAHYT